MVKDLFLWWLQNNTELVLLLIIICYLRSIINNIQ